MYRKFYSEYIGYN